MDKTCRLQKENHLPPHLINSLSKLYTLMIKDFLGPAFWGQYLQQPFHFANEYWKN